MNQEKIGKFIASCRKQKHLTQNELANLLGVSDKSVSKWENAKCMPDISLFNSLCDVLGITINDLMSGEIVDKHEYVPKLEENVVKIVTDINKKKKKRNKIIISIVIFLLFVVLGVRTFYYCYEINVKYDKRVMTCNIENSELKIFVKGQSVWNTYHTKRQIDGDTVYFFHSTISIYNKRRSHWEYAINMGNLIEGKSVQFGSWNILEVENNPIKVYYIDSSIKTVEKATNNELKDIIKKSYLMCEHK